MDTKETILKILEREFNILKETKKGKLEIISHLGVDVVRLGGQRDIFTAKHHYKIKYNKKKELSVFNKFYDFNISKSNPYTKYKLHNIEERRIYYTETDIRNWIKSLDLIFLRIIKNTKIIYEFSK